MALTGFQFVTSTNWALQKSLTPWSNSSEADSLYFSLSSVDIATWTQVYVNQLSIAAAGTQTIDISSFTNLVAEATTFAHVLAIYVQPTGAAITFAPGAANGLVWFFGAVGNSIAIQDGGYFSYSMPYSSSGQVVDGTHKNLLFTNTGGSTTLVNVVILGKPT